MIGELFWLVIAILALGVLVWGIDHVEFIDPWFKGVAKQIAKIIAVIMIVIVVIMVILWLAAEAGVAPTRPRFW